MRKLLAASFVLLAAGQVQAGPGSIKIDARVDQTSTMCNDDAGCGSAEKIYLRNARLDFKKQVNDDLFTRVRIRVNRDWTGAGSSNLSRNVDYAFVRHNLGNNLQATFGKFWSDGGGYHMDVDGADLYMFSHFTDDGPWWDDYGAGFVTGAMLAYTQDVHTIEVQALNDKGEPAASTRKTMGLVYKGSFMEGNLGVMASHHMGKPSSTDGNDALTTVGLSYTMNPLVVTFDYNMGKSEKNAGADRSVSGWALQASYGMGMWTPKFAIAMDSDKSKDIGTGVETKTDYTRWAAAVEYKPYDDTDFRYHVAYNSYSTKVDGGTGTPTVTQLMAGIKIGADVLK